MELLIKRAGGGAVPREFPASNNNPCAELFARAPFRLAKAQNNIGHSHRKAVEQPKNH